MKIIAYGSLMNQKSLESTLQRAAKLRKLNLSGWIRVFNAPFDGYSFLNLVKKPDATIKVAYFVISRSELKKFSLREEGSELIEVEPGFYAFIWPENKTKFLPVLQSYINVCECGAKKIGINISINTRFPKNIINDCNSPRYH